MGRASQRACGVQAPPRPLCGGGTAPGSPLACALARAGPLQQVLSSGLGLRPIFQALRPTEFYSRCFEGKGAGSSPSLRAVKTARGRNKAFIHLRRMLAEPIACPI